MLMFELYAFRLRPSGFGATSLPLGFGVTRPSPKVKLYTKIVRLRCFATTARQPSPFALRLAEP